MIILKNIILLVIRNLIIIKFNYNQVKLYGILDHNKEKNIGYRNLLDIVIKYSQIDQLLNI
jgi:hypothetical protein